jgi:hypothetical protein
MSIACRHRVLKRSIDRPSGQLLLRLLASAMLVFACGAVVPAAVPATGTAEWIRGGGFEQGFGDFEVYRYPRFFKTKTRPVTTRVENGALSGHYSLLLPGLEKGGYRFVLPEYDLVAGAEYRLTFRIRSTAPVWTQAELFSGIKNISRQAVRLEKGDSRADFTLRASQDSSAGKGKAKYRIVIWISTAANVLIDDISLSGPGRTGTIVTPWLELVPDNLLGIYGIGEPGRMRVSPTMNGKLRYRIVDAVHDVSLTGNENRPVGEDGMVDLITARRGAYRVEIYAGRADGNREVLASRRYAVIDRERAEPAAARYGIAMEEHGLKTQVDARIQAADFYRLAAELGAGSVRIFTLAMPDIVSDDGVHYDFSQIDGALEFCRNYGLEPLVELGSNVPDRLPGWLRTSESRPETIDLTRGLATKKLRDRLARSGGGQYLDLAAYERYLRRVFEHLGDKVRYFEIWNEPGHKFLPDDYLKIARLTRRVQQENAPHAKLAGYSSTKRPGRERQESKGKRLPGFLDEVLSRDRAESIDVLSYHSAHAFKFMEEGQTGRGDETGYVDLLRATLARNRIRRNLPIWDTERGVPWSGHRARRHGSEAASLEVARRLPGIHAASLASHVGRLFWFYMESSTSTIARPAPRYGFFDANLEPMPQVAVYDAMTEVIGGSRYVRRLGRGDGLNIYFFENDKETILMAFNWRRRASSFNVEFPGSGYKWLDVMGNGVMTADSSALQSRKVIQVDGWPSYLVFPGTPVAQVRVPLLDH